MVAHRPHQCPARASGRAVAAHAGQALPPTRATGISTAKRRDLSSARGPRPAPWHQTMSPPPISFQATGIEPGFRPIDKSVLALAEPRRIRDTEHLRFVASQPCLVCGRSPSEAHHLRFAQPRAMSRKVSDEFTVPLCALHHRDLHARGNEEAWWEDRDVDCLPVAAAFWTENHTYNQALYHRAGIGAGHRLKEDERTVTNS